MRVSVSSMRVSTSSMRVSVSVVWDTGVRRAVSSMRVSVSSMRVTSVPANFHRVRGKGWEKTVPAISPPYAKPALIRAEGLPAEAPSPSLPHAQVNLQRIRRLPLPPLHPARSPGCLLRLPCTCVAPRVV